MNLSITMKYREGMKSEEEGIETEEKGMETEEDM